MAEISTLNGYKIKDKKAIRFYNTVADIKSDILLKNGQLVETKGYFTINDGGGCLYEIVDDIDLVVDNGINFLLDNNLKAKKIKNIDFNSNFDLYRIGRKILKQTDSNACCLQGGCIIDNNVVAYMLWDNLNLSLNKNKLVIMDLATGEILRDEDFSFGWCNSLAYKDGSIYVCVRGTSDGTTSTNNGIIKVIDSENLTVTNTITLPINVNAISIFNDTIYALEENTTTIRLYDLDGTSQDKSITLDIDNIYNQDIKVTKLNIFLISSRPSELLTVFDSYGNKEKTYNIPKNGGIYFIGEPQFIDVINDNDMILGSSIIVESSECINQFFKFNLTNNISTINFNSNVAQTLYVDSTKDYYNPDGTVGNEFTSVNEVDRLVINNIQASCNNKNYGYTRLSDHRNLKIINATFDEGLYAQYGTYTFETCTFDYSKVDTDGACVLFRDSVIYINGCTFDAENNNYCINSVRYNDIQFVSSTFTNYTNDIFSSNIATTKVRVNHLNNTPFINRVYGMDYNLFANGNVNKFKPETFSFATNLSSTQIAKIIDSCTKIKIGFNGIDKNNIEEVTINKRSDGNYILKDISIYNNSVNVKIGKMALTVASSGVTITTNATTTITSDSMTAVSVNNSTPDSDSSNFIKLRYISFSL